MRIVGSARICGRSLAQALSPASIAIRRSPVICVDRGAPVAIDFAMTMTVQTGSYFPDRDQPPLSEGEEEIVRRFHDLYYRRWQAGADTINLSWFGYLILKCPLDLWIYQELLVRSRPDVVIECGTYGGGSALFLAMMLDQIGHGEVITIDIESRPGMPQHPRITYLTGSSTDPLIVAQVKQRVGSKRVMAILDSDHRQSHVLNELTIYSELVHPGDYLIVEDTSVNGHPTFPEFGPGPMEAVEAFLARTGDFVIDDRCERFLMTLHPRGYLKRKERTT
jgi:cephalosporin hydroxylase